MAELGAGPHLDQRYGGQVTLDQEDMAAIEALIRRIIREEGLTYSGASLASPITEQQGVLLRAAERAKKMAKKAERERNKAEHPLMLSDIPALAAEIVRMQRRMEDGECEAERLFNLGRLGRKAENEANRRAEKAIKPTRQGETNFRR